MNPVNPCEHRAGAPPTARVTRPGPQHPTRPSWQRQPFSDPDTAQPSNRPTHTTPWLT